MAKMQQFTLEIQKRADKDSQPDVGDPFEVVVPPLMGEYDDGEEYEITEGRTITVQPASITRFMSLQIEYELAEGQLSLISSAMTMFFSCLSAEDRHYIRSRFNDRNDPFGLDNIAEMIELMMETWSARPTKKPSGSSSSQRKRGSGSTPKQPSQDETSSEN